MIRKHHITIIGGTITVIIGLVTISMFPSLLNVLYSDPLDDPYMAAFCFGEDEEMPCYFETNYYDVWYVEDNNPREVRILDGDGNKLLDKDNIGSGITVISEDVEFTLIGSFHVGKECEGTVFFGDGGFILISIGNRWLSYANVVLQLGGMCFGGLIIIVGLTSIAKGVYRWKGERGYVSYEDKESGMVFDHLKSVKTPTSKPPPKGAIIFPGLFSCPNCKTKNLIRDTNPISCTQCNEKYAAGGQGRIQPEKEIGKTIHETKICPKCREAIPITSQTRPLKVTCSSCATSFMVKGKTEEKPLKVQEGEEPHSKPSGQEIAKKIPVGKTLILGTKTCPKCRGSIPITTRERPLEVSCSGCNASFTLKKKEE